MLYGIDSILSEAFEVNSTSLFVQISKKKVKRYLPDYKLDTVSGSLEELHCLLMRLALHTAPIDTEQLVTALETSMPVRHAPGDDPGDVDGRVLLLPSHHIEAKSLFSLGQLHHSRVSMTF